MRVKFNPKTKDNKMQVWKPISLDKIKNSPLPPPPEAWRSRKRVLDDDIQFVKAERIIPEAKPTPLAVFEPYKWFGEPIGDPLVVRKPTTATTNSTANKVVHVQPKKEAIKRLNLEALAESDESGDDPDYVEDTKEVSDSDNENNELKSYPCEQCKKVFATRMHLAKHLEDHPKPRPQKRPPKVKLEKKPDDKVYTCRFCAATFDRERSLAGHLHIHKGQYVENAVQCKHCDAKFNSKAGLRVHRKKMHPDSYFKCSFCDEQFSTEQLLETHLRHHDEAGSLMCHFCGKTFAARENLRNHVRAHTGERPFSCEHCKKSFGTRFALRYHMRRHDGNAKYPCPICGKLFYESSAMRKHSFVHMDNKPHKCDLCNKGFISPAVLQNHRRVHTGEKPYKCDFDESCGEHFRTPTLMKRHVDGFHKGLKPFVCEICNRAFLDKGALKSHEKRIHYC